MVSGNDKDIASNSTVEEIYERIRTLDLEADTYRRRSNQHTFFAGVAVSVAVELMLALVFATDDLSCILLIPAALSAVLFGLSSVIFVRYAWQADEFLTSTAELRRQLVNVRTSDENRDRLLSTLEYHANRMRLPLDRKRKQALCCSGLGLLFLMALMAFVLLKLIIVSCLAALKLLLRLLILLVQLCL